MKARLVLNPRAGRGRGARARGEIQAIAKRLGVEVVVPEGVEALRAATRAAVAEGCERLLVAGGDGTYHQAAQELARSGCGLVPIGVGTGNDLARELGLPLAPAAAIPLGLEAPLAPMDLGRAGDRWFCGVAGSGIDSETAEYSLNVRRLRGPLVYVWSVVVVLRRFRAPWVEVEIEGRGETRSGRVMMIALANTRYFGGGMKIAPMADRGDGHLDLVRLEAVSRLAFLRLFPRVYRGRHVGHGACRFERVERVRIRFDREMALWGDGERLARVDGRGLEVGVERGALLVPETGLAS
jgi:diacylglycerol kinase (ATP)